MNYVLAENKTTILLGPISWKPRFIQSELDDLEVSFIVSPTEPNGYVYINDSLEIYPAEIADAVYDNIFEEPAGPFWSFKNEKAIGYYDIVPRNLIAINSSLKQLAAAERYRRECLGTQTTIGETVVSLYTDREGRRSYQGLTTETTISFKFPEGFVDISQLDIDNINSVISNYVQQQFDWEKDIVNRIDACNTHDELKALYNEIIPPVNQ